MSKNSVNRHEIDFVVKLTFPQIRRLDRIVIVSRTIQRVIQFVNFQAFDKIFNGPQPPLVFSEKKYEVRI